MTENEAKGMLQAELTCRELEDKGQCIKNCDECEYCYAQGTVGEHKKAVEMAIQAFEYMQILKEFGECYIIPKNGTFEINEINVHTTVKELEQYRAIGTVEGYERAIQSSIENYNLYREYKAKVQAFEAIGTIEEFKALKEPQKEVWKSNFSIEQYKSDTDTAWQCGYNKALKDFAERLKSRGFVKFVIDQIVEEMKGE